MKAAWGTLGPPGLVTLAPTLCRGTGPRETVFEGGGAVGWQYWLGVSLMVAASFVAPWSAPLHPISAGRVWVPEATVGVALGVP